MDSFPAEGMPALILFACAFIILCLLVLAWQEARTNWKQYRWFRRLDRFFRRRRE